jgi:acyl-CoA reductase-like NAD-dependent aldehyde dehydrogenase
LILLCWKIGPSVAAGCTTIIKLDEHTPLTGLYAAKLIKEAGFPPVNLDLFYLCELNFSSRVLLIFFRVMDHIVELHL